MPGGVGGLEFAGGGEAGGAGLLEGVADGRGHVAGDGDALKPAVPLVEGWNALDRVDTDGAEAG